MKPKSKTSRPAAPTRRAPPENKTKIPDVYLVPATTPPPAWLGNPELLPLRPPGRK